MYDDVYSVSQVNKLIKALVEGERRFANIQVRGEISNFKRYSSGHCYFTLKDAGGVLKAVMFKQQRVLCVLNLKTAIRLLLLGA